MQLNGLRLVLVTLLGVGISFGADEQPEQPAIPPSPGDPDAHPGLRIYDPPGFTHWPAVIYRDEVRNAAFTIPVPPDPERDAKRGFVRSEGAYHNPFGWQAGSAGTVGWRDGDKLPLMIPEDPAGEAVSGLLGLPEAIGRHHAELKLDGKLVTFGMVLSPVITQWQHHSLRNGFAVDDQNMPVVTVADRPDPAGKRRWGNLRTKHAVPEGPAVVIGDPLAWPGGDVWQQLSEDVTRLPVEEQARIDHGTMVALAAWTWEDTHTMVWSPGNRPLLAGHWLPGEERVLIAIAQRWAALEKRPRLVLLLPPMPTEPDLQDIANERRQLLRRTAQFADWEVLDATAVAGAAHSANAIGTGVYTTYPCGDAGKRLAQALATLVEE